MFIPVKSAILHSPLFMDGANLGDKINITGSKPCQIVFDTETRMLQVKYKKSESWISVDGGVASFMPTLLSPSFPAENAQKFPAPAAQAEAQLPIKSGKKHSA